MPISRYVVIVTCACLLFLCPVLPAFAGVLPGIDVLISRKFDILQGKRVGLITNQTGRTASGASTIDVLFHAPSVRLVALFSPEHGIRGTADEKVGSGIDPGTGLPVYSLYGSTCSPTPEMLAGVDILVFDIQDIGTRFYTYIGTLSLAMRSARKAGIPFVVLDRPNPIGGLRVEGAIPPDQPQPLIQLNVGSTANRCSSLTSIHPIPTRHGMTVGELARLFNTEFGIRCDLKVVTMSGWKRSMYYDETGLPWIDPSPNMKSLGAAILYPGLGILESTNLSVGRGTDQPFRSYGAPWADGEAIARNLAGRNMPGITFTPCRFTPTAGGYPYAGRTCSGVCVTAIDRERLKPVRAGLQLVQAFYELYKQRFRVSAGFAIEVGTARAWEALTHGGKRPAEVTGGWREALERFKATRARYLLY